MNLSEGILKERLGLGSQKVIPMKKEEGACTDYCVCEYVSYTR